MPDSLDPVRIPVTLTPDEERGYEAASRRIREWAFRKYLEAPAADPLPGPKPSEQTISLIPEEDAVRKGRAGAAAAKRARRGTKTRKQINAEYRAKMGKRTCTIEGCKSGQHAPGLCAYHAKLACIAGRQHEGAQVTA
jgi:hypothetical protein